MNAVDVRAVTRQFPGVRALDAVDLSVEEGEIFGLLGPNGSGKTTLFNCLQGLDRPTSGTVSVLGLDPQSDLEALTLRMGVQLQSASAIPRLTVREVLRLFASFYPASLDVDDLLRELGLESKAGARLERLSGGQRQRVYIALAMVNDPELLFFDELTSAVDPQARLAIWDILRGLRAKGHTIMLTSHSMEEAQALCDRIAIIDAGRIIALGTPVELIARHGGERLLSLAAEPSPDPGLLEGIDGVSSVRLVEGHVQIAGSGNFAPAVLSRLANLGSSVTEMTLREPDLEDVFVALTGREMRDGDQCCVGSDD